MVHASYRQRGGEDAAVDREVALLRARGHEVVEYRRSNADLDERGAFGRLGLAARAVWARDVVRELRERVAREVPDVAHVHNTHFAISPAALRALHGAGVPVVQTLHNYRLLCANGLLFREGRVCDDCVGSPVAWRGAMRGCYRGSRATSAAVAAATATHSAIGTWSRCVDRFVALTEFQRAQLVRGGLPAEKIAVKPNFVDPDPGPRDGAGDHVLFVGRLAPEKGVEVLLRALDAVPGIPARVVGDGPLLPGARAAASRRSGLEVLGWRRPQEVTALLQRARCLVVPSEWYEGFPLVVVEAFACGVPVVASRLGSLAELVENGETGVLVPPGDAGALAAALAAAWERPDAMAAMGARARRAYERRYTADEAHRTCMSIYAEAIASRRAEQPAQERRALRGQR